MSLTALKMSFKATDFPSSGSRTAFRGNVSLESYHLEQFLSLKSFKIEFISKIDI